MLKTLVVKTNNMSSKFSSPFFQKSPLYGAYASGADAVFAVSDAPHFAKLQNDTLGGVLASDKKDPCQKLEDRYSSGVITKQRYMDGLKNCGKNEKDPNPGLTDDERAKLKADRKKANE